MTGIYLIIAVKNKEEEIEGFMRSILFKLIYGKEESIKNLIVADLDSTDKTVDILTRLKSEYDGLKVINWRECKDIIDNIDEN